MGSDRSRRPRQMHELGPIDRLQRTSTPSNSHCIDSIGCRARCRGSTGGARDDSSQVSDCRQRFLASVRATDRSLVIVPTGRLHGLPWRALPALAARPTVVAPSPLMAWAFADRAAAIRRRANTCSSEDPRSLPRAPELAALAPHPPQCRRPRRRRHPRQSAASPRLGDATLAHLACHGSFRSDNPLFSTLRVADGDITVYDLEQCERLPRTMVLSACNAAASSVLRGGALLGMSSALIQLGVSSVIAPLTPVSDERSVALMTRLHRELLRAPTGGCARPRRRSSAVSSTRRRRRSS